MPSREGRPYGFCPTYSKSFCHNLFRTFDLKSETNTITPQNIYRCFISLEWKKTINVFPTSVTKWAFWTSTKQLKGGTREGCLFFDKSLKGFDRSRGERE